MVKNLSFGAMQQELYKFTVKRMLPHKKQQDLREDILYYAEVSDTFWTEDFDQVWADIERNKPDFSGLGESLSLCIESISSIISNYYSDRWNFPPGYVPVALPLIRYDDVSWYTLRRLAKKIAPKTMAAIVAQERRERAARKRSR